MRSRNGFLGLCAAWWLITPNWVAAEPRPVGLDLNRDGLIQLISHPRIPLDETSPSRPFIFWVNEDQDDLEISESWPIERPDHTTPAVDSVRDLEDLYPLWIEVDEQGNRDAQSMLMLSLKPGNARAPAINLFRSADRACTNQQLVNEDVARAQLGEDHVAMLGSVSSGNRLEIEASRLGTPIKGVHGWGICLLMEGAATGSGQLRIELANGDGSLISRGTIDIEIRPVKSFYKRTRIDWPERIRAPWTYGPEQPPDPELQWVEDSQGIEFDPPWYEDKHVLVWVYGWQTEGEAGYLSATVKGGETIFKRLWHRGFKGRLVFLHWPTIKPRLAYGLFQSEYRAYKSGPALKDLVESQPSDRVVHVTAHSLGSVVLTEALRLGMVAEDAMFQVGAVPAGSLDPRDDLTLPEVRDLVTPDSADEFGYRGYLRTPHTRLYNMYNPSDHTWIGWNLAQHLIKPTHESGARYEYNPDASPSSRYMLKYRPDGEEGWRTRQVTDHHEVMAFIARSKTHPIGGEARLEGPIEHKFDIGRPPFNFGHGHTVGWSWTPQRTVTFFNLILDAFNIAYKSPHR